MDRSTSISRDKVLINEYERVLDKSSETIIRDPELTTALLGKVNKRLRKEIRFDEVEIKKRLETLHKNSKLPKKFRAFNGRTITKEKPK